MLMPTPSPSPSQLLAQNLRETNSRLRFWLDGPVREHAQPTPQQMAGILSALLQAGQWLRLRQAMQSNSDFDAELADYREIVERLREIMPSIHNQLLWERSRLEAERARVNAATAWAQSSLQTL
jgi:hypothetical protein